LPDAAQEAILQRTPGEEIMIAAIDVHVTQGGTIVGGELNPNARLVAHCALCGQDVESAASLTNGQFACAPCLRERLDALSVARFRLKESGSGTPWGKVTG
jgi:hypothetical protein